MAQSTTSLSEESQNKGPAFLTVALLFTILSLLIVLLRVYVRTWVKSAFGWDDVLILLSTILAIIGTAMNVVQVNAGFGRHMALLSVHQRMEALKWNWLASPFLVLSLATSKVSICLFLLRVLKKTHAKRRKYFLYLIIGSIVGLSVPAAGYCLGQCQPVEKLWNKKVPGFCHDHDIFVKVGYTYGATNVAFDFVLALFPMILIKDLKLEIRRRIVLGILMSCGVVCGIIAMVRTILTGNLSGAETDYTYDIVDTGILSLTEENVSIIVACVPTLRPLLKVFRTKISAWRSEHYQKGDYVVPLHGSRIKISDPIALASIDEMQKALPRLPQDRSYHESNWDYGSKTLLVMNDRKGLHREAIESV